MKIEYQRTIWSRFNVPDGYEGDVLSMLREDGNMAKVIDFFHSKGLWENDLREETAELLPYQEGGDPTIEVYLDLEEEKCVYTNRQNFKQIDI